jgi:hypothetical protein
MRTATQIRAHADDTYEATDDLGSGRRLKAATATESSEQAQLALAMSDALEHILEYERRSA